MVELSNKIAIFISIPRNASNSIRSILSMGPNRAKDDSTSLIVHENHQRIKVLSSKYDLKEYFIFCFVRNPYDRCVSWYEFHKHLEPYRSLTFETWIKKGFPHHWKVVNETNWDQERINPLLQYSFVENYKVDYIGKIENFNEDIKLIVKKLNLICKGKKIKYKFKFRRRTKNKSKRIKDFKSYYNEESLNLVYKYLKKDFIHFNYYKK